MNCNESIVGSRAAIPSLQRRGRCAESAAGVVAHESTCSVSDHPGAPSLETSPYRARAVAPPLLRKEGISHDGHCRFGGESPLGGMMRGFVLLLLALTFGGLPAWSQSPPAPQVYVFPLFLDGAAGALRYRSTLKVRSLDAGTLQCTLTQR